VILTTLHSYKIVLDTDAEEFGGHKRIDHNTQHTTFAEGWDNRMNHMFVSKMILLNLYASELVVCVIVTVTYLPSAIGLMRLCECE